MRAVLQKALDYLTKTQKPCGFNQLCNEIEAALEKTTHGCGFVHKETGELKPILFTPPDIEDEWEDVYTSPQIRYPETEDEFLNIQLPCDITIGHGTHKKGTNIRTLMARFKSIAEANKLKMNIQYDHLTDEEICEILNDDGDNLNTEYLIANARDIESAVIKKMLNKG
jgi:hypothetical protein